MDILFLDFESYYDQDISLKKLTYAEYLFHPEMVIHMVGAAWNKGPVEVYSYGDMDAFLDSIYWDDIMVVSHNILFDGAILEWWFDKHPECYCDTVALSQYHNWPLSHSLEDCAKRWFPNTPTMWKGKELILSKGIRRLEGEVLLATEGYCGQDTKICQNLYYQMIDELPINELNIIDHTAKLFFRPRLHLDLEILGNIEAQEISTKKALSVACGVSQEVLRSNDRFADELGKLVDVPTKISPTTGKRAYAFSKADLAFQALMVHPDKDVRALIAARVSNKSTLMEKRAKRFIETAKFFNGMIPVPMKYCAAKTRRFGGTQKLNFLNIPKNDMRKAVLAPPGHMLVTADMSQIECRLLAMIAGEDKILAAFREQRDIYCEFGKEIYNRTITKADYKERFVSKGAVLGLGYHLGGYGFNRNIQSMAKTHLNEEIILGDALSFKIVNLYRKTYAKVPKLWQLLSSFLSELRSTNPNAFLTFRDILTFSPYRIGLPDGTSIQYAPYMIENTHGGHIAENICQALGRILLVEAILKIEKDVAPVAFHVYDEVTCVVPESQAEDVAKSMCEVLSTPMDWCADLPLDAEAEIERYYAK